MRILTCGFESQQAGEMTGQNHNFATTPARGNGGLLSAQFANTGHYVYQDQPSIYDPANLLYIYPGWAELFIRFACYLPSLSSAQRFALQTVSGAANVVTLEYGGGTAITAKIEGTSVGVSNVTIPVNTWHLVEVHYKNEGMVGVLEIRQNGEQTFVYRGAFGTGKTVSRVLLSPGGVATAQYYDDIAINDMSGYEDTSWCGDGYVERLAPNGNGAFSQFTGSDGNSVDNYLLIDERPANDATDFVYDYAAGHKDTYALTNMVGLETMEIKRVYVSARVLRWNYSGPTGLSLGVRSGTSESWSQVQAALAYARRTSDSWLLNPSTGVKWTESEVNGLEIGVRVDG